jgi:hypothetical protein
MESFISAFLMIGEYLTCPLSPLNVDRQGKCVIIPSHNYMQVESPSEQAARFDTLEGLFGHEHVALIQQTDVLVRRALKEWLRDKQWMVDGIRHDHGVDGIYLDPESLRWEFNLCQKHIRRPHPQLGISIDILGPTGFILCQNKKIDNYLIQHSSFQSFIIQFNDSKQTRYISKPGITGVALKQNLRELMRQFENQKTRW